MAPDGRKAGFLALGAITGDWGGGGSLGMDAQWWAIRYEDGRGPRTVLRQLVPAHFGLAEPTDLAVALHLGKIGFDRMRPEDAGGGGWGESAGQRMWSIHHQCRGR